MAKVTFTALDIFKILPKTNCGKCQLPSCLAFAAAIMAGNKKLKDCPDLDQVSRDQFSSKYQESGLKEINQAEFIDFSFFARPSILNLTAHFFSW